MKSFTQHYAESKKVYEFRLRLAVEATSELMDLIESALDAYKLESISKPKRLPVQEDIINFPKLGPVEINLVEVTLGYPAISEEIQHLLYERAGVPMTHICVYTASQEGDRELPEVIKGEAILGTEYEDVKMDPHFGDEYNESMLKELETRQHPFDAPGTEDGKTTNELPQGTKSPVGSQQNKLPTAKDYK